MEPRIAGPNSCAPPSVQICDASGCSCVATWNRPELARCQPPLVEQCVVGRECFCAVPTAPIVVSLPGDPADACSIVVAIVVAGVKKTLLACWVDG